MTKKNSGNTEIDFETFILMLHQRIPGPDNALWPDGWDSMSRESKLMAVTMYTTMSLVFPKIFTSKIRTNMYNKTSPIHPYEYYGQQVNIPDIEIDLEQVISENKSETVAEESKTETTNATPAPLAYSPDTAVQEKNAEPEVVEAGSSRKRSLPT